MMSITRLMISTNREFKLRPSLALESRRALTLPLKTVASSFLREGVRIDLCASFSFPLLDVMIGFSTSIGAFCIAFIHSSALWTNLTTSQMRSRTGIHPPTTMSNQKQSQGQNAEQSTLVRVAITEPEKTATATTTAKEIGSVSACHCTCSTISL